MTFIEVSTFNDQQTNTITDLHYIFYQICLVYTKEITAILKFECDSPLAQKVHSYIHAHLYDKLSTSLIADTLNFSVSYVCAEFKKAVGKTLTAHIQSCKINDAKYLLKLHALSPSDISRMLGFSSPTSLFMCSFFIKSLYILFNYLLS